MTRSSWTPAPSAWEQPAGGDGPRWVWATAATRSPPTRPDPGRRAPGKRKHRKRKHRKGKHRKRKHRSNSKKGSGPDESPHGPAHDGGLGPPRRRGRAARL